MKVASEPLELNETQRAILRAVCDTFVPSVDTADDNRAFFDRKASDTGVDRALEQLIASFPEDVAVGLFFLLEVLAQQGFIEASTETRIRLLGELANLSEDAAAGVKAYRTLTLLLNYALPDATGKNANWAIWGYPGPSNRPPAEPKVIRPLEPSDRDLVVDADVCVVGSGAGGGVIAARLAEAGMRVVILEAGGYFNEADFDQLELTAYRNLFYRSGLATAVEGASLLAGSCLGGGTTVNWTNCVRTPQRIRHEWAALGLNGVDGPEFDAHLDAVLTRISANDACSDLNVQHSPSRRLREARLVIPEDRPQRRPPVL